MLNSSTEIVQIKMMNICERLNGERRLRQQANFVDFLFLCYFWLFFFIQILFILVCFRLKAKLKSKHTRMKRETQTRPQSS